MSGLPAPAIADVEVATRRIRRFVWHTPLVRSAWLSEIVQADIWLKLEIAQTTGSFKLRGAANALAALREAHPEVTRVVAASAGNHGLALAWAANRLGYRARVYLPPTTPATMRQALVGLGAELVDSASYDEAERRARQDADQSGAIFVSAYNDPEVIAGAGTVALEMLTDQPDLDAIVAPLGGGGLLAGTAIVARAFGRRVAALGAEVMASPAFTSALAAGKIVAVDVRPTLADKLAGNIEAESRTFALVRDLAGGIALVAEPSLETAMRGLVRHEHLITEGSGAAAVGALLQGAFDVTGKRVGVILSGRNVDPHILQRVLTEADATA
jgi:threonine dehydratase